MMRWIGLAVAVGLLAGAPNALAEDRQKIGKVFSVQDGSIVTCKKIRGPEVLKYRARGFKTVVKASLVGDRTLFEGRACRRYTIGANGDLKRFEGRTVRYTTKLIERQPVLTKISAL